MTDRPSRPAVGPPLTIAGGAGGASTLSAPVLRIAFDATPLLGERTGIGVAVGGLLEVIAERPELSIIGYGLTLRGWSSLRSGLPANVRSARAPMPAGGLLSAWSRWNRPTLEHWTGEIDVAHGTNFVVPPTAGARRLVSVWDLTPVRFPELCTPTALRYPELIRRAVGDGAWVHTGAHAIADEIVEHFGVDPDRVRVIPPGKREFADLTAGPPAGEGASAKSGGGRPYVLGLGTTEPRKDFPLLVAAFDSVADRYHDLELLIAGPSGWAEQDLGRAISAARHSSRIRRLGWVDDLARLLAGATVFAYPSIYEGFGFPPLEAMSAGVPVVASATGAIPEVVGDAALLVPPRDAASLAAAIETVLADTTQRERLVEAGRRRVAAFTLEAFGASMAGLYSDIVAT